MLLSGGSTSAVVRCDLDGWTLCPVLLGGELLLQRWIRPVQVGIY